MQALAQFVEECSKEVKPHALKLFAEKVQEMGLDLVRDTTACSFCVFSDHLFVRNHMF